MSHQTDQQLTTAVGDALCKAAEGMSVHAWGQLTVMVPDAMMKLAMQRVVRFNAKAQVKS